MRKRTIGGLFAATLTFSAIVAVSSCNEEDEYYNDSNYTLAKKTSHERQQWRSHD